jgi:hypothetical protein
VRQGIDRLNGVFDWIQAGYDRLNASSSGRVNRVVGAGIGIPTSVVLAIALWLTPSPAGYGTHTQLGLGSCTMLTFTGWPCPMCGMTTTFALMAHLRPLDALKNQPFGVVLFSLTVIGAVVGLFDLVSGRGLWRRVGAWIGQREQGLAILLLVGMISGWLYKCALLHPEILR